jgi:hypothetical protein
VTTLVVSSPEFCRFPIPHVGILRPQSSDAEELLAGASSQILEKGRFAEAVKDDFFLFGSDFVVFGAWVCSPSSHFLYKTEETTD